MAWAGVVTVLALEASDMPDALSVTTSDTRKVVARATKSLSRLQDIDWPGFIGLVW